MNNESKMKTGIVRRVARIAMAVSLALACTLVGLQPTSVLAAESNGAASDTYDCYCGADMVTSVDWMSAISGERSLHDVNIPGTHDSGCASVECYGKVGGIFSDDAVTQKLSVHDQLEAGVRLLDLRVTDYLAGGTHCDGTLQLCHGGQKLSGLLDLTYYCTDARGEVLDFEETVAQIADFLHRHSSEAVIVTIKVEYTDGNADNVMKTVQSILGKYSDYLYTEDKMPLLEEVRGKMVVIGDDSNGKLGYGMQFGKTGSGTTTLGGVDMSYENTFKLSGKDKLARIKAFYKSANYQLPKNVASHAPRCLVAYTSASKVPFSDNPADVASTVNPDVFADGGLFSEHGRQFGWVYSDFVDERMARKIWESNFVDNPDCVDVTYTATIGSETLTSTFTVLRGTTIIVAKNGRIAGWGNLPDGVELDDGDWEAPEYGDEVEICEVDEYPGERPEVGWSLDGAFAADGDKVVADRDLVFEGPAINENGVARIVVVDL